MDEETRHLMRSLLAAWERGASIYKDGRMLQGVPEFGVLMEDSRYMLDVEEDDRGDIVRINFQKLAEILK